MNDINIKLNVLKDEIESTGDNASRTRISNIVNVNENIF